ncbi:hypothetical protein B0H21DRAFT_760779 [Amylocystis lapponica]|nr:hypothetical protein B0H21DRAFT_760779 [Amylocystis lapponica]
MGAVIGGVVGGIGALALVSALVQLLLARRRRREEMERAEPYMVASKAVEDYGSVQSTTPVTGRPLVPLRRANSLGVGRWSMGSSRRAGGGYDDVPPTLPYVQIESQSGFF